MSRLEQLIAELCPDGVEYKSLEDIVQFRRGSFPQPYGNSNWYGGEGSMPFVQVADVSDYGFRLNPDTKQQISKVAQPLSVFVKTGTVIVTLQGTIGRVAITQYDCYVDRTLAIFNNFKVDINKKYFAYQLKAKFNIKKETARGSTIKTITVEEFSKFTIPIPPLNVQHEVVDILDNFTKTNEDFIAELTGELKMRNKQYDYYRNLLLTFGDNVDWNTLGEVAKNLDSKRRPITKGNRKAGEYPYYGASGIVDYVSEYIFDGDYLLVSEDGANLVARVTPIAFSASGKIWVNNHAHVLEFKTYTEKKFIEYYLNMIDLGSFISTAAQPKLTQENLNKIPVPVPSLKKQEHIVNILDRYDVLCNSLINDLSAEIEARQKQYEYYRDKLLTFKEVTA